MPPFRAEHSGSVPRPADLVPARGGDRSRSLGRVHCALTAERTTSPHFAISVPYAEQFANELAEDLGLQHRFENARVVGVSDSLNDGSLELHLLR